MSEQLNGRRVLVTGAASGIGAAIAARLAAAGAIVAGLDLQACPQLAHSVQADLGDDAAMEAAFAAIEAAMGAPDIVVHAGAMQVSGGCLDTDPAVFAAIYNVNVIGAVRLLRWCVPAMRARGGGAVLLLSSINASFATPTLAAYAASKAALENLCKTAALELAPDGIRVNAIAPASIDTPMLRASYAHAPDALEALARNATRHPLARLGTADEVAELALFLVSEQAGWITGAIYPIDGGASVTRR
jgi:NAD(P)-dependent dehydrogenase (short-subunit alcohol dehydrogenase family)